MKSKTGKTMQRVTVISALALMQGCLATRNWVSEEALPPVTGRMTAAESRLDQTTTQITGLGSRLDATATQITTLEGRVGKADARVGALEGRIGQVDARAEKALSAIANLRLEKKLVVDFREGATFPSNSANLPARARKEIDSFLGNVKVTQDSLVVVAGHSDATGSPNVNYELGKRRADAVARYLITQKQVDPFHVHTVSYGESAPLVENKTRQDRAKNRRVEILVYREAITTAGAAQ